MATTTKAAGVTIADWQEARRLRRQAAEMMDDLLAMSGVLVIMLDDLERLSSYVWLDVRETRRLEWVRENAPVLDGQIRRIMEQREALLAKATELETGKKGAAA